MSTPKYKRKKFFTKGEIIEKLAEQEQDVSQVVDSVLEELAPFDIHDDIELHVMDRINRLDVVSKKLAAKVYKLRKSVKDRKFRHKPDLLEDSEISCSQYSILQSQEVVDMETIDSELEDLDILDKEDKDDISVRRPASYKKIPLNGSITNRSRRRRVASKVSVFKDWAIEEGIEVTELLGYFLHLENWNSDKTLSNIGWNIFTHTECFKKPEVSVEEATWIIEKTRMSQSVWTDIRLRLLDRIYLPPVKVIRSENKNHRPKNIRMEYWQISNSV